MTFNDLPFVVSAPGKVILFGEHSAVHCKPAISAAINLRAYLLSTISDNNTICLEFPDIKLSRSWNVDEIPWDKIDEYITYAGGQPEVTKELVPEIIDCLEGCLDGLESTFHYTACLTFLYLYVHLCSKLTIGRKYCIRSTLPIGAGLGSSAAVSVCLATALALLGKEIEEPHKTLTERSSKKNSNLESIDAWSFIGEKCFHGTPSGIDNAVSTYGGAVMYQRMKVPHVPAVRTTIRSFPPIRLLLTNTKIPRSTAELVGGVSRMVNEQPLIADPILTAMEEVSKEAYRIMLTPSFGSSEESKLHSLVDINHGLLVSLGVSHPSLEKVKILGDELKLGATKLTGAGGGGCAITLVNSDSTHETILRAKESFSSEGFEAFETSLGGKGVGAFFVKDVNEISDPTFFLNLKVNDIYKHYGVESINLWRFW